MEKKTRSKVRLTLRPWMLGLGVAVCGLVASALLARQQLASGAALERARFNQAASAFTEALTRLTRAQREVFVLVHLEGFTLSQAAEISGKALGTLKSHLHRALASLREQLGDLRSTEPVRRTP